MRMPAAPPPPAAPARAAGWRRVAVAMALALGVTLLLRSEWTSGLASLLARTALLALVGVFVFGLFERWPRRLPGKLPRWLLQVVGVGVAMPATTVSVYLLSTPAGAPPFWLDGERADGFMMLTFFGVLLAPWTALGALLRRTEAFARHQALAFELERSELERQTLDARLRLLRAQVAPHFLFNTLANLQALADAGSPRTSAVLRSLTVYLRAAVPALDEPVTTLGREVELVRAYLDLMHLRMPDRLRSTLAVDDGALALLCPPATLLTLVENAVRHGIDPGEEGGAIEVEVRRQGDRCLVRVRDTGVGLAACGPGAGTGLAALRERLALTFGGEAEIGIAAAAPRGVVAELRFPAREVAR